MNFYVLVLTLIPLILLPFGSLGGSASETSGLVTESLLSLPRTCLSFQWNINLDYCYIICLETRPEVSEADPPPEKQKVSQKLSEKCLIYYVSKINPEISWSPAIYNKS